MRCEIIAVGTELLLGQHIDTNSAWIGEQLALSGIDCHYQSKVGDNRQRIADSIRLALSRSDAVILCGGLGPTPDDITRDAIAEVMGVDLLLDEAIVDHIRARFRARGREMPENNRRQAEIPRGASTIPQLPGTAPGLLCPLGDQVIYAVPGVPAEMKVMVEGTILPDLIRRSGTKSTIKSRVLRTWGESESGLAERIKARIDALDQSGNPTLAFLASGIEGIKVRITAKATDPDTAAALIAAEEAELHQLLGDLIFGYDDQSMEYVVVTALQQQQRTLCCLEEATGGLMTARLSAYEEAQAVFTGGLWLGPQGVTQRWPELAQSPPAEVAQRLAQQARELLGGDIGLATAGELAPALASSTTSPPPGVVYIGIALGDETTVERIQLPGRRSLVRELAVISALNALRLRLRAPMPAPSV